MKDIKKRIEKANEEAVSRLIESQPLWIGCDNAVNVIPGMSKKTILHAGPPIKWENMCRPMRSGILGAIIFEGLAKNIEQAETIIAASMKGCIQKGLVGEIMMMKRYAIWNG